MTTAGPAIQRALGLTALAVAMPGQAASSASWATNMTEGATALQHRVYDLHMLMFAVCAVIGGGVLVAMLWSILRHRKSRGVDAAHFHESTWVEIAWTVIPFIVLIAVAIPAVGTLVSIENNDDPAVVIDVTAHQWLWEYGYVGTGVHFYSRLDARSAAASVKGSGIDPNTVPHYLRNVDHPMVVPVNVKILLRLTSGDVNHAWWVPELGGKMDAIPGRINKKSFIADRIGVYRGQCAELCGRGHAFMPIVVRVVSKTDYAHWLQTHGGHLPSAKALASADGAAATKASAGPLDKPALMAKGKMVYENICAACHQSDGRGLPNVGFPALAGDKIVNGPIAGHIQQVLHGGGAMPAFRDSLSDQQIAAVVTYERNAFGNHTGDVAQPAMVAAQRKITPVKKP